MNGTSLLGLGTLVGVTAAMLMIGLGRGQLGRTAPKERNVIPIETTKKTDGPAYSRTGHAIATLDDDRIEELAGSLTDEERRVILNSGTEAAFCGNLTDNKKDGTYICRLCQLPMFNSSSKFTSGTGWPSFFRPFDLEHIAYKADLAHGMKRVEILCTRCNGHLGHVFEDGPEPTGLRYCVNSVSLDFVEEGEAFPEGAQPVATKTAYFAGGCFWGLEDHLQQIPGVINAVSGYQGGEVDEPGYRAVCSGKTGHAESVKVIFDPEQVAYTDLLEWFFRIHDPTQLNRQGPDIGTQYRSAVFASDDEQYEQATQYIEDLQANDKRFRSKTIVTEVNRMAEFFDAEEYHQDYHEKHGGSCALPKWDD